MKPTSVAQQFMPVDVRNFVLQRAVRRFEKAMQADLSPEKRLEIFEQLSRPLFEGSEWRKRGVTEETMNTMVEVAFKYLGNVPLKHCLRCNRPVFMHQATKTDSGYLCEYCVDEPASDDTSQGVEL